MDSSSSHGVEQQLDIILDVEFTFIDAHSLAQEIAVLNREKQHYLLDWAQRVASTNIELAHQFLRHVLVAMESIDRRVIEMWALESMNVYDKYGLHPSLKVIREVDDFIRLQHEKEVAAVFEDHAVVLQHFAHGLSGRQLELKESAECFTDSEQLFLPKMLGCYPSTKENFLLYKSMVAFLWAQTRFGTFRKPLTELALQSSHPELFIPLFFCFETLRLEACIGRHLPGLYRDMMLLKKFSKQDQLPVEWQAHQKYLSKDDVGIDEVLNLTQQYVGQLACFGELPYQGELRPELVEACKNKRVTKEKAELRTALLKMQQEQEEKQEKRQPLKESGKKFDITQPQDDTTADLLDFELSLDDQPVAPPENVKATLRSIFLDFGEIPDEYLVAAGPGEYDPKEFKKEQLNPDDVWQGTYHEQGAFLYDEWDYRRQHYKKNWCAVREKQITPRYDDFAANTLDKYHGLIKHLRKTFEAMRDEDRLLKRQVNGDGIDIDAWVEAMADAMDGSEMSDRLYTRMHRTERNIAVVFMVDMSGSTKGWINDAERESLVLLAETLEKLGDRYAIYGFSGMARKRCEIYKIKHFEEKYDAEIKARISAIEPQDYTRMGFAIRHLTQMLADIDARTRILITLSDGKPDDYDNYRGDYGIQDTRRALIEARRKGVHPYCITIDTEAKDYLSHMYGSAEYTVIDSVTKLPLKVSDIYRRLTT